MGHRSRLRTATVCVVVGLAGAAASGACTSSGSGGAPVDQGGPGPDASTRDASQDATGDDGPAATGDSGSASPGDSAADASASQDAPGDVQDSGTTFSDVFVDAPLDLPCGASAMWGAPTAVLTTPAADATIFSGITPDALTVAWTSTTAGTVTAWIADRASTTVAFGTPQALSSTFGALAFDRVSVSGDGLRVVGVRADTTGFIAATRSARPGTFDTDDSAEFAVFLTSPDASTYASPLLSPDNQLFLYLLTSSASDDDLVLSASTGWMKQRAQTAPELARKGGQQRRPTGMTQDELTLFYWDEVSGTEKVAYGAPFSQFGDLGNWQNAAPTGNCSGIYYSAPAASGAITIYSVGSSGM